jgi:hypothetical protein
VLIPFALVIVKNEEGDGGGGGDGGMGDGRCKNHQYKS